MRRKFVKEKGKKNKFTHRKECRRGERGPALEEKRKRVIRVRGFFFQIAEFNKCGVNIVLSKQVS